MTSLTIADFDGIAPLIATDKLADNMATVAMNTRFDRGTLAPWKGAGAPVANLPVTSCKSLYQYQGSWLASGYRRQFVKALIPGDVFSRLYYTDFTYPKLRSGSSTYRLGLPRPVAPTVAHTINGEGVHVTGDLTNVALLRQQAYVVTLVDAFGNEGPPSLPTPALECGPGASVDISLTSCLVTGNYNLGAGALFRIYRTNNSSTGAVLQYLTERTYGTDSVVDTLEPEELQELLQSQDWIAAPDDNTGLYPTGPLASLVEYPGGILAGHSGSTVYFSVPYVPTAWPYSYTISETVVGVVVIQGGLFVCTTGRPVLITGSSPDTMAVVPVESYEACVNGVTIVDMGDYALYVSPRGIVRAHGNTAELVTEELVGKDQWATLVGDFSLLRAFRYEGKYVLYYGADSAGTALIYDPAGGTHTLSQLQNTPVACAFFNSVTGDVYCATPNGLTHDVGLFNAGGALNYTWASKDFITPDPLGLQCIRVEASAYPITLTLYADGVNKGSWPVPSKAPLRLPGGYRARRWRVSLYGAGEVSYVQLAESLGELT